MVGNLEERLKTLEDWLSMTKAIQIEQLREDLIQTVEEARSYIANDMRHEISDEEAIDQLQRSGWMQRHDRAMSFDSLTEVVNGLMLDGNKTISVNIYPWKGDDDETA